MFKLAFRLANCTHAFFSCQEGLISFIMKYFKED